MYSEKGQSLIELVVVVAVLVIVITALTFATIGSLRNAQFSKNQVQATKLAQEGLEWARVGRDRNQCIINLDTSVNSWNGSVSCPGSSGAVWSYPITGTSSNCENLTTSSKCYFKVDPSGSLNMVGYSQTIFPQLFAESIQPIFRRVITLSDDASFASQKTVTAIVTWTDFSGPHESRLTTILRKI